MVIIMGLPQINIRFIHAAQTAVTRSANGIVALLVADDTKEQTSYSYAYAADVDSTAFTVANLAIIKTAFTGSPNKVIIERVCNDDLAATLVRLGNKRFNWLALVGNINADTVAAYLSCTELMNDATKILVEFDTKFGDRWQIGLADLDQRPGESTGSKYTSPGVAFYIGTSDGSRLYVNGSNTSASITDIWMHVRAVIDFKTKTTEYIITNRETGVVINSGTVEFRDPELTGITGIEVYTWYTGELCIDNIEITANYEAQDNIIYLLPTGDGRYLSYVYIDYKPVLIGDSTPTQPLGLYTEEPQRIATWLDGTPVWRVAFKDRPVPYLSEEPTLYTDKSYSPFYDYERRCSKYVKSNSSVLMLNGMMQLNVSGDTVLCKRWNDLEFEADIGTHNGFINHATMYFTGYAEFVTPKENIKEG